MAPHIRVDDMQENERWSIGGEGDFREHELSYYRTYYQAAVDATNERYIRQGHSERCKTVEQLYTGAQTRPEEMILQIGNREEGADPNDFKIAVGEYISRLEAWNRAHGGHMHILNWSIHLDESSPHVHIRRVWDYQDKDGILRLGQNKALKAAGVPLPDPDKPEGRYNNRKITFDSMARGLWQDIARSMGYDIEAEPRPDMRHKDKAEYIAGKLQEEIDGLKGELRDSQRALSEAQNEALSLKRENLVLRNENLSLSAQNGDLKAEVRELDSALMAARAAAKERQPVKRLFRPPAVEVPPEEWTTVRERAALNSHLGTFELLDQAKEVKAMADQIAAHAQAEAEQLLAAARQQSRLLIEEAREQKRSVEYQLKESSAKVLVERIKRDHPELFDRTGQYRSPGPEIDSQQKSR